MKIVDVQPRDFYVTVDFSLEQIKWLHMFLERAEINYDSEKEPEMVKSVKYMIDKLYPDLVEFIETMESEHGA